MEISPIKVTDLSKLTDINKTVISRYFKDANENEVARTNNRIIGISANAVNKFLLDNKINYFEKGAIVLSANLCGGVGKTTATNSLSACIRRIIDYNDPIIMVDTDSQGSLTSSIFNSPAKDNEPILIDFLEGKVSLQDILSKVGNNIWFIKSNLNQAYIDKVLSKPADIKKGMLRFYNAIFDTFGKKAKIFQDHTPQLSNIFASSICALSQLNNTILKAVLIPMRSDNYAIDGAEKIINEINELQDTFNLQPDIDIHCFFSSIDKRVSTTTEAIKAAQKKNKIMRHLSPVVIRYSAEIPKSIQSSTNVYCNRKNNKAGEDYQDLLQNIFSYQKECEIV